MGSVPDPTNDPTKVGIISTGRKCNKTDGNIYSIVEAVLSLRWFFGRR